MEEEDVEEQDEMDNHEAWQPPEPLKRFRREREELIRRMERQSDAGSINTDEMVRLYSRVYDQPVLTLVQDVQIQMAMYYNVFEELKRTSSTVDNAREMKARYVALGLISQDNEWPNPARDWLMNKALSKMREYWQVLRDVAGRWRRKITDELNLEPTMAVGIQMTASLPPAFTITIQPEATLTRTV